MPAPYAFVSAQAVPGNADVALMARVRNYQGILVTQASLSAINYTLSDLTLIQQFGAPQVLGSGVLTIGSVWTDQLVQNDPSWTKDSASQLGQDGAYGYNFKGIIPYTLIPIANSGDTLQCDVYLSPVAGGRLRVAYKFPTFQVFG
jgi:hypothetical protein